MSVEQHEAVNGRGVVGPAMLLIPLVFGGCAKDTQNEHREQPSQSKPEADPIETVASLMKLLAACDREGVRALMFGDLYSKLETSKKLDDICSVVGWLGDLRSAELLETRPDDPGVRSVHALTFERGELTLDLYVVDGEVAGLGLSGDDYLRAGRAAEAERYATFAVHDVSFSTTAGRPNPNGNRFEVGEVVVDLLIGGLELGPDGAYRLEVHSKLIGPDQTIQWQDPEPHVAPFVPKPDERTGAINFRARYTIPEPGKFRIDWAIRDQISDRQMTHSVEVVVVEAGSVTSD